MLKRFWKMLDVEPHETGPVGLLLIMSFLMGLFLATVAVASQSLFLKFFNEKVDLPIVLVFSGVVGIVLTVIYNFLQGRIPFSALAIMFLVLITGLTAFIEYGSGYVEDVKTLYQFGFILILPFTFVVQLVFWGAFGRMFNVRDGKRLIGSVDVGTDIASIMAFFTIPILLTSGLQVESLYTVGLFSIIAYTIVFFILSRRYLGKGVSAVAETDIHKLSVGQFLSNKYIMVMAGFIVVSLTALRFIDYSFYNVTTVQYDPNGTGLPIFLSLFEASVVIFGFAFTTFVTDRIAQDYGLRVAMIINPMILLILFTAAALGLGSVFGYDPLISGENDCGLFLSCHCDEQVLH